MLCMWYILGSADIERLEYVWITVPKNTRKNFFVGSFQKKMYIWTSDQNMTHHPNQDMI